MPYINLQITRGATREQKRAIVAGFTETLARVLDKKPEHTHIVIQEIDEQDWGFCGMLTDEWRAAAQSNVDRDAE
ncbi:4-oxalocrotonate tautomerase family protein [Methylosinus sp. Sm6]|uniref:tautomerase family protein n=1 Tax=Methylosinus sp. Sm6 TaxID=2866948 RepID=UPI001C9902ED|nr:4-oxalocrotonate tautomerase family protein [Methylosinus sp. Sm6]